jgi:hypothetical protein
MSLFGHMPAHYLFAQRAARGVSLQDRCYGDL